MPTFIFFRNKTKIDKIQGADNKALEEKVGIRVNFFIVAYLQIIIQIKQHYGEDGGDGEEAGVKGI